MQLFFTRNQSAWRAYRPDASCGRQPANPTPRAAERRRGYVVLLGISLLTIAGPRVFGEDKKPAAKASPPPTIKHRNARPAISADGRVVVFQSTSPNIVSGDSSGARHIYAYDRITKKITRVSVNDSGKPGDKQSFGASISSDGRYVAFISDATNLVEGDTNDKQDVFVRDRKKGTTVRISVSNVGEQANADCHEVVITADGRVLAFSSISSTLDENINNRSADIFLCDREAQFVRRITRSRDGYEADHDSGEPSISANGRFVAFYSHATNITPKDTNLAPDIYLFDSLTGTTELISVASNRMIGNRDSRRPRVSADGRFVVFESWADNLVVDDQNETPDIFLRDRESKKTICVSTDVDGKPGNDESRDPRISDDGNFVVFTSYASNLVADDTNNLPDVFVYDRKTQETERVNLTDKREQAAGRSGEAVLSGDGKWVAFASKASNLVEGDTNRSPDIFLVNRSTKKIIRISDPKNKKKSP